MVHTEEVDVMPRSADEREPGVYVRSNRPDQELDFLWDKERKKSETAERFHLGFFMGGAIVGSLVTFAATMLFMSGGKFIPVNTTEVKPILKEEVTSPRDLGEKISKQEKQSAGIKLPFLSPKSNDEAKPVKQEIRARMYEVQSGDTLGSIAIKFYGSSAPEYVERIQRANQMTDADTLSIGQRLSVPPKTY